MIILPSDGSTDILFKRDVVDFSSNEQFGFFYPRGNTIALAATRRWLLYNAFELLSRGSADDPSWDDEGLEACWMGDDKQCALYKPFYDTAELIANNDRDPDYFERHGLSIDMSHPIPFHLLTGISGEAPEEYPIIYDLVLRTLKDYAQRPYPWLLALREFKNENRHVFYVSRTSALFCALKLIEMTFNEDDRYCEIESIVRFFRIEEGNREEWWALSMDEIDKRLQGIQ